MKRDKLSRVKFGSGVAARILRVVLMLVVAIFSVPSPALDRVRAQAGDLDPTFGNGGIVITHFNGDPVGFDAIASQQDGKIVVAGGSNFDFALARYLSSGNLDPAFGQGGIVTTDFFGGIALAFAVIVLPDGKIVAAGIASNGQSGSDFALARYNADGSLDPGFGLGGKVHTDFGPRTAFPNDEAHAIAIQEDGKLVVAGTAAADPFGVDFAVARYNLDGSLDSSFGVGGLVTTRRAAGFNVARAVAVQQDGKIVLAGHSSLGFASPDFALVRYNSDGTLDSTFGTGGFAVHDFGNNQEDSLQGLAIQRDGKLVAAGHTLIVIPGPSLVSASRFVSLRYNANGSMDPTFGAAGTVVTEFPVINPNAYAADLAIQNDGKIIAAGGVTTGFGQGGFAIARYNFNGSLDATFGLGGTTHTSFAGLSVGVFGLALQQDGKIIVGGGSGLGDLVLARYDAASFDLCLQDDSSGSLMRINSNTGEYQFVNCRGIRLDGMANVVRKGCLLTLQGATADRRVTARIDNCLHKGSASVQMLSQGKSFTITDRNTADNQCSCP